jgi:trimethylamine:corrinoid methyltransferase-like protein
MVIELLGDSAIDIIIEGADRILGEVGIQVDDAETLDHLSVAGATVHPSGRVRWAIAAAQEVLATAPRSFELQSRNPALSVRIGGAGPVFAPVYGPPNVIDDDGARRLATMADYTALVRIASDAAGLQTTGHMICVPTDVDEPEREDVMARAHLAISEKRGHAAGPRTFAGVGSAAGTLRRMSPIELTKEHARRIAIAGQLLTADRPRTLVETLQGLCSMQLDQTSAIAPSADLVAWSRLGDAYRPDQMHDGVAVERTLFEYRNLVYPMSDLPLYRR